MTNLSTETGQIRESPTEARKIALRPTTTPATGIPRPTDAAFLRNLADLSSGKASARLREIADLLDDIYDGCAHKWRWQPSPQQWVCAGCGQVEK